MPDRLWHVAPPACFAPLTTHDGAGSRRTFDLLNREGRVDAYTWLLQHGEEEQLFTHLDGALLVDAWPEVAPRLPSGLRRHWQPLVLTAGMGWLDGERVSTQEGRPKPASLRARERAIRRLVERASPRTRFGGRCAVDRETKANDRDRLTLRQSSHS